mmetsp:Transcript_28498/g.91977  ORF Transcript_28498/g.91977 Transcript_28498/m.91977 type:complete len:94 (-) Transcript_28498:32-313(-)
MLSLWFSLSSSSESVEEAAVRGTSAIDRLLMYCRAHLMEAVLTLFYTLLLLACFVLGSDTARLVLPSEKDGDHEHLMIASFTTSSLHFLLQRM